MRLVILRRSGIESALVRFDGWWSARAPRERLMLGVLAVLIGGVVLVYGVVKPLQAARAQALADIRTYETLNARIRAAGTLSPNPQPRRSADPAEAVRESAAAQGLSPTVEAIPNGVRATIADGSYESVMAWIGDIGATTRLRVVRVAIRRLPAAGHVTATLDATS